MKNSKINNEISGDIKKEIIVIKKQDIKDGQFLYNIPNFKGVDWATIHFIAKQDIGKNIKCGEKISYMAAKQTWTESRNSFSVLLQLGEIKHINQDIIEIEYCFVELNKPQQF